MEFNRAVKMTTQEAIDHFGGVKELAAALGIWPQAVYKWGDTVPRAREYEIKTMMRGDNAK